MGWRMIFGVLGFVVAGCASSGAACCEGDLLGSYVVAECGERFCIGGSAYQCVGEGNVVVEDGLCGGEMDAGPGIDGGPMGSGPVCENTCVWANDGECDDGGPGSLFSECALGTDCADCGPRDPTAPGCACDTSSTCDPGCACDPDECRPTGTLRVVNVSSTTTIRAVYSGPCGGPSGERLLRSNETIRPGASLDIDLEVGCHDVDAANSPFAMQLHTLNGLTITEGGVTRAEFEVP